MAPNQIDHQLYNIIYNKILLCVLCKHMINSYYNNMQDQIITSVIHVFCPLVLFCVSFHQ